MEIIRILTVKSKIISKHYLPQRNQLNFAGFRMFQVIKLIAKSITKVSICNGIFAPLGYGFIVAASTVCKPQCDGVGTELVRRVHLTNVAGLAGRVG